MTATLQLEKGPVDLRLGRLETTDGPVRLTTKELALLIWLAERPGQDVSREELLAEVWGYRGGVVSRTVDATLLRLRGKVEVDSSKPRHLLTITGFGYRFVPLPAEASPTPTARSEVTSNLVPDASSFLGRESELTAVAELREERSVVTVTGTAGTGKTRLARQVGLRASEEQRVPGGVWFCDLTEARDDAGLLRVIGRVLGVLLGQVPDADAAAARIGEVLQSRPSCLVILDNAEQIVEAVAIRVAGWARESHARFLVTSREVLRIRGEAVVDLAPLAEEAAVELFTERATAVRSSFTAAPEEIALLVRRLDHLPLAIELAAARVGVLSPVAMLDKLERRFDLLATRRRDLSARQQTLRGALDWSWDLLQEDERAALAQCSVFRGGFGVEAAEAVLSFADDAAWPPDLLQSLVERSLLRTEHPVGTPRLSMLESIRDYAAERLGALGRFEETARRHARWYLDRGDALGEATTGINAADAFDELALEVDNLLAVLERSTGEEAARAALAIDCVLRLRGPAALHRRALTAAIEGGGGALQTRLLAARARAWRVIGEIDRAEADVLSAEELGGPHAVLARAHLEEARGHPVEAIAAFRAAADGFSAVGDVGSELEARRVLAFVMWQRSPGPDSEQILREARAQADAAGFLGQAAGALATLGLMLRGRGLHDEAMDCLVRARDAHRAVGDRRSEGIALSSIAAVHVTRGEAVKAEQVFREALAIQEEIGEVRLGGVLLRNLGMSLLSQGRIEEAEDHFARALSRARKVGDELTVGRALADLGEIRLHADDLAGATRFYEEGLEVTLAQGNDSYAAIIEGNLALAAGCAGDLPAAEEWISSCLARLEQSRQPRVEIYYLAYGAVIAVKRGDGELAARRLASARGGLSKMGDPVAARVVDVCEAAVLRGGAPADVTRADALVAEAAREPVPHDVEIALRLCRMAPTG